MQIELEEVGNVYKSKIEEFINSGNELNAINMIELSKKLFEEIKIEELADSDNHEDDMFLFQYGVYGKGKYFEFDLTRQFYLDYIEDFEPYQVNFTLIYPHENFENLKGSNCWSSNFDNIEEFFNYIKSSEVFALASENTPKTYELMFSQC